MSDNNLNFRKKLLYISTHRGTKEGDLIIGGFAKTNIFDMSDQDVQHFADLLQHPDAAIMDWVKEPSIKPEDIDAGMVDKIRTFISTQKLSTFD